MRERATAEGCVRGQLCNRKFCNVRRPLHIAQLTHVKLPTVRCLHPAQEGIRRSLHESLPLNNALALVLVDAGMRVRLEDALHGFLRLKHEQIIFVTALQQEHESAQADTADTHHLVTKVDNSVTTDEFATIVLQLRSVFVDQHVEPRVQVIAIGDAHQNRRLIKELTVSLDYLGHLCDRRPAIAQLGLANRLIELLRSSLAAHLNSPLLKALRADAVVPDREIRHACVLRHRHAVRRRSEAGDVVGLLLGEGVVLSGEHEARGEPHDIPFKRTGIGLVEIIDVKDDRAILAGEHAEVRQVSIATQLHRQSGVGHGSQIEGHDCC